MRSLSCRYSEIYMQVSVCNVIRSVMEGKALVSLLADIVEDAEQSTVDFLIMVRILGEYSSTVISLLWHVLNLFSQHLTL